MINRIATLALCLLVTTPALAEKADRNKPMLLEANSASIDDAKKVQILVGDVIITKGTMVLKAERVVITEDKFGFQKGVAYASDKKLAYFRQKQEGKESWVEGEAERIEYDTNSEVAEFFQRAWVKNGEDKIRGDYIWYDSISEKYLASSGKNANPKAPPTRVRATIQPKAKDADDTPAPRSEPLQLKDSKTLAPPASR